MSETLDLTFDEKTGRLTVWLPIFPDGEHCAFAVAGRVDPYIVIDLARLAGKSLTVRIIDPNGDVVEGTP